MGRTGTLSRRASMALALAAGAWAGAAAAQTAAPAPAATVSAGRDTFNGQCAHCHGGDATQTEEPRNLRQLSTRYGKDARLAFDVTVREGRPGTLMQSWADLFTDEEIARIWAFLESVQGKN
ncbi:MAG: cytochrome c [Beijerinckiaceae bacterium]